MFHLKPKDIGISPYLTLDDTSNILQVYFEIHPEHASGDSGASNSHLLMESAPVHRTHISQENTKANDRELTRSFINPMETSFRKTITKVDRSHERPTAGESDIHVIVTGNTNLDQSLRAAYGEEATLAEITARINPNESEPPYDKCIK